jgi:acetoin utilization protein AcuA
MALEQDYVEDWIIIAMGFSWHWDLKGLELTSYRYRQLIGRLFANFGFAEYPTSEPNIKEDPANIFLARIGRQVKPESMDSFFSRLLSTEILLG